LRTEGDTELQEPPNTPIAFDPWQKALQEAAALPANDSVVKQLHAAILGAPPSAGRPGGNPSIWELINPPTPTAPAGSEYPPRFDSTAVLLARVRVPATRVDGTTVPVGRFTAAAWANPQSPINNLVRHFVIAPAGALRAGLSLNV
jgi:hypothetical protein